MDSFMDKLAQRLKAQEATAQESIRANHAAEAAETEKLKGQLAEYKRQAEELRKVCDSVSASIVKLTDESLGKIEEAQISNAGINDVRATVEALDAEMKIVLKRIDDMTEIVSESSEEDLRALTDEINEGIHKECVKVYRNVQATIVEENGRQTDEISALGKNYKNRLAAITWISVISMLGSLASIGYLLATYFKLI